MKKRILSLLCLLLLACLTLTACLVTTPPDGNEGDDGKKPAIGGGTMMLFRIIKPDGVKYDIDYDTLRSEYLANAGLSLYIFDDTDEAESDGELVFGETNRTITATAKSMLESEIAKANNDDEIGYIIYCNGKSIALYWTDHFAFNIAYDFFHENFVLPGIDTAEEGVLAMETMDKSESKAAQEAIDKENDFAAVEEMYGEEVANALRAHYDLFDERYYIWMANLYDPGTGGFYYSNSGLANPGFLPDVESTQQAFAFFGNAGMYRAYTNGVAGAVPQWMQEKAVEWVRGLQSPVDGYFYHPQWASVGASRLSRDLGWATTILKNFGSQPKWNAPNGTEGEFGKVPGVAATVRLSENSVATAVSYITPAAVLTVDQFPTRLRTLENWRSYIICDLNGNSDVNDLTPNLIRSKSYSIGNTVASQSSQIIQRDKLAVDTGELPDTNKDGIADGGFIETFEELFNLWQLENGLWETYKSPDPTDPSKAIDDMENGVTYYDAINGLMKISGGYNSLGIKIPYLSEALGNAIYMINYVNLTNGKPGEDVTGKKPSNSVDVYNPWVCVNNLFTNLNKYHLDPDATAEFRAMLQENALEMIRNTTIKTVNFRKPDGSFGYMWEGVPATSQGAPVAVSGTNEGDINGGSIAVSGITRNMCSALGIANISIYRDSDWDVCLEIFENASPVIKDSVIVSDAVLRDFEDYESGTADSDIDCVLSSTMNTGSLTVVTPPADTSGKNYGGGNALEFVAAAAGSGDTVKFAAGGDGSSCYSLEFDVYFQSYNIDTVLFQITMGSCYRLTLTSENGMIKIGDDNNVSASRKQQNLGVYFTPYEWHRIKVEYYPSDAENVVAKVYLDEQLRAVSTNYYGRNDSLGTPVTPGTKYTDVTIYSLNPCIQTVYFDNIMAEKSSKTYVEEDIVNPYLVKDFETDDSLFKSDVGGATVTVDPEDDDNKVLYVSGSKTLQFVNSTVNSPYNCFANEFMLYAKPTTAGELFKMYFSDGTVANAPVAWSFVAEGSGAAQTVSIYEVSLVDGNETLAAEAIATDIPTGEWTGLRLEYYRYQYDDEYTYCKSIIYSGTDGDYDEIGRGEAYYEINNMRKEYDYVTFVATSRCSLYLDNLVPTKEYKEYLDEEGDIVPDTETAFPSGGASVSNSAVAGHTGFFDFEDSELGLPTTNGMITKVNTSSYGNKMEIVEDDTGANRGKVLNVVTKKSEAGSSSSYVASKTNVSGNCYVLEYDIFFNELSGERTQQCYFKTGTDTSASTIIAYNTSYTDNGDGTYKLRFWEKAEDSAIKATIAENILVDGWTKIRVEYYKDAGVIKFYVNGDFVGSTENYYNEANKGLSYGAASISGVKNLVCDYYLDDITVEVIQKTYVAE